MAVPRKTRFVSIPLCADPMVGAAPKETVRASRLVSARCPKSGCWGMHDTAFVAALPLGIVLPERVALPAGLRETL